MSYIETMKGGGASTDADQTDVSLALVLTFLFNYQINVIMHCAL